MCLYEIGDLGKIDLAKYHVEVDLEPLMLAGINRCVSGRLIAIASIPTCPGFRRVTVRDRDGSGDEVTVSLSTLVFYYCNGRVRNPR